LKTFKIKKSIKPEVKQWCLDNLGTETVRWWVEEDLKSGGYLPDTSYLKEFTLILDVTEEEESRLTFFILKYGQ
jgi:hypothetical protein